MPDIPQPSSNKKHLSIPLDMRLVVVILLIVIAGMLFAWKPWQNSVKASERTVTVTGDATIAATPDEYVFSPSYDFTDSDQPTALAQLSKQSDQFVSQLKALGVPESGIKTDSSNYSSGIYLPVKDGNSTTYTLTLTITVDSKALAQKVQDYLVTTNPTGAVSPQADFSDSKQKALQSQARDQATKDARSKADQSAKNLGFKVAAVKTVTDGDGFNGPISTCGASLLCSGANDVSSSSGSAPSLSVQPGQNKLQYSVTVVYYIR